MKRVATLKRSDGSVTRFEVEMDEPAWVVGLQQQLADVQQQLAAVRDASLEKGAPTVEWSADLWKQFQPPRRRSDPNWKPAGAGVWSFRGR